MSIIGEVQFNITFNGAFQEYQNFMGFVIYDFNDSEILTRQVNFQEQPGEFGQDIQTHQYKSYGSYFPRIILTNNISQIELNLSLEVEQCVSDFKLHFENITYIVFSCCDTNNY